MCVDERQGPAVRCHHATERRDVSWRVNERSHAHPADRVFRTGTESLTIIEAHPYHQPIGRVDHKGAGEYVRAYDPCCPLCRKESKRGEHHADPGDVGHQSGLD